MLGSKLSDGRAVRALHMVSAELGGVPANCPKTEGYGSQTLIVEKIILVVICSFPRPNEVTN